MHLPVFSISSAFLYLVVDLVLFWCWNCDITFVSNVIYVCIISYQFCLLHAVLLCLYFLSLPLHLFWVRRLCYIPAISVCFSLMFLTAGAETTCAPVTCDMACDYGYSRDASGCEICECQELVCRVRVTLVAILSTETLSDVGCAIGHGPEGSTMHPPTSLQNYIFLNPQSVHNKKWDVNSKNIGTHYWFTALF